MEVGGRLARACPPSRSRFDPTDDIALLRVPDLDLPALRLASRTPPPATAGAILGYPENGPFDAQPGRIGRTQTVITQNAYGQGRSRAC